MKLPFNVDLKDKVAVVTGGSGILCGAMADALAECGAKVAILALGQEACDNKAKEINEKGGRAIGIEANVLDKEALEDNSSKITFDDKGRTLNKVFFSTETTPCLFENRITYSVEDSEEKIEVVNKFYVESIQNCSENKVKKYEYQKACDNDIEQQVLVNLIYAPNRYYIKYSNNDFKTLH